MKKNSTKAKKSASKIEKLTQPLEYGFEKIATPFQEFVRDQTTASVILMLCTVTALVLANSSMSAEYESIIHTPVGFVMGDWTFTMSIRHWVNDGLMALFFFILGLEIKREILVGELSNPLRSMPVIAAAIGGMVFPALIFYFINRGEPGIHGWGIPMATDTAFAIGVLALLSKRIPPTVTMFITALAIIDDLGAILVIALFYTASLDLYNLGLAGLFLLGLVFFNILGIRSPVIYMAFGALVWMAMLKSGVHTTVAGVLIAMTVPARPERSPRSFLKRARNLVKKLERFEKKSANSQSILAEKEKHQVVEEVKVVAAQAITPLQHWERALQYPVVLLVLPVFALTNAGVSISAGEFTALFTQPLSLGIILGLLLGKCLGISLFCWISLRLGFGQLLTNMNFSHVIGISLLGGMGFTMSIFIANLGFSDNDQLLMTAKSAILLASAIAGITGYTWLRLRNPLK